MNENGQKISKLCVVGLILPILSAVLFWGGNILSYIIDPNVTSFFIYVFVFPSFVLPFIGLVFSILGVYAVKKNNKGGARSGVAGIIISVLEIVLLVIILFIATGKMAKAKTTPPEYTMIMHTSNTETDNTSSTATT